MANENNLRYLNKLLFEGDNENIDVFKIVETIIEGHSLSMTKIATSSSTYSDVERKA